MVGVGVGTGALGSVIGKLATLLGDEYKMLKRVRKDIAFLERELRRMQILVNVLADMEGLDEVAKDWKASMREISYDMEECINRFMLRLGNGDAKPGFRKKTVRRLKTLFERHGIGTQIKELKARVSEEDERRQRLNLDNYAPATNVAIDPRLAAFHRVAIDGPRDQITSWLTEESVDLKLVAIAGGGGLGKTTLAIETYRTIGEQFQCRASVSVSGTLDPDKFLEDILSQIDEAASSKYQLERWKKDELIREIQRILTGKRGYLSWENKHIRNIGSFHQLRYLRMDGVWITELPADTGKLQNLETMDLRGNYCFNFKLPSTIAHLQKLVRLFIGNRHFVFSADMFGSMRALEEVSDICKVDNPEKFLEELGHLTKLRKLSMSQLFWSEDFECYRERLGSSLNKLVGDMESVPKGMASLTNILKLEIAVRTFDEEGLHILMGMPSLAYLLLGVIFSCPLTVSSNGFKLLEVFHYDIVTGEVRIEFAAGAMPALRRLHLFWHAQHVTLRSSDGAGMGIQHLSSLVHLQVETDCTRATLEEVEALEGRVENAVTLYPNRETLHFHLHRKDEYLIFKDEEER
uniref:Putative disease resistance RPP13-like protein 2 n=1 Tax=Aegilops tauschii TaxID=37682 RepID=M8C373_AEGTA